MDKVSGLLKAFVIGGGIVLVAGTLLLIVVIVARATGERAGDPPPAGPVEVPLPAGAEVREVVPDGRRLILLGVDGTGAQFVAVVDAESGALLRLLRLRPAPGG